MQEIVGARLPLLHVYHTCTCRLDCICAAEDVSSIQWLALSVGILPSVYCYYLLSYWSGNLWGMGMLHLDGDCSSPWLQGRTAR